MIRAKQAPPPLKLSAQSRGWPEADIAAYQASLSKRAKAA
jgi:predicted DNA-binding transcriptional regulator AlpA